MTGGNLSCWTSGFTFENCCNIIYGPHGNGVCWDDVQHNFNSCCLGEHFRPQGCEQFVTYFDYSVMRIVPVLWDRCSLSMERHPGQCDSVSASAERCPECAYLSEHAWTFIRCVRQLQASAHGGEPVEGATAAERRRPMASVGGWHYPTVFLPRAFGRDFSVAAPAYDAYVGNRLLIDGQWMPAEVKLLLGFSNPGDVVVDAGANIGAFTLAFAKHVGEDGIVHAFEPFRLLFQCLNANIMLNGFRNVHTYQLGLGNRSETVRRRQPNLNTISNPSKMHVVATVASELMVREDKRPAEPVRVVRLDDVEFGGRGPALIKVDVESMEFPLIQGAEATLRRWRPILYIEDSEFEPESDGRPQPTRLMAHLVDRGYVAVDLVRSGFAIATSMLFIPAERQVELMKRLRSLSLRF